MAVKFINDCVFVVSAKHVSIAALYDDENETDASVKCALLAMFQYSIRDAAIWVQKPLNQAKDGNDIPEVVSFILRCDDGGFETLKQFDCIQNPKGVSDGSFGRFIPLFPPVCTRTIMIPPSSCNFLIGAHGKGVFFETKTITTSSRMSYTARCLGGFELRRNDEASEVPFQPNELCTMNSTQPVFTAPEFIECRKEVYSRRCDMGEIMYRRFSLTSVALEDDVGRIAIGDRNGILEVMEYA